MTNVILWVGGEIVFYKLLDSLFNKSNKVYSDADDIRDKKENELYKEIYTYANNKLEQLHERKRHIEIKSLYVLQATAVVVTLFTALLNYCGELPEQLSWLSSLGIFSFYVVVAITIFFLISSLNDGIVTWRTTRRLIKHENIRVEWDKKILKLYGQGKVSDNDVENTAKQKLKKKNVMKKGYYLESPHPRQAIAFAKGGMNIEEYYKNMVDGLNKSIDSADLINTAKNMYFNKGIKLFVCAIFLVIFLGILVA